MKIEQLLDYRKLVTYAPMIIPLLIYLAPVAYVAASKFDNKTHSDAVVVLNTWAGQTLGDPNPCLEARIRHGADLLHDGWAQKMIVMNHKMADLAQKDGVDPVSIIIGSGSVHTDGEAIETKRLMDENHLETAIIVTEQFQNLRAGDIFGHYGVSATLSPAAPTPCSQDNFGLRSYSRDALAWGYFQILKVTGGRYPTGSWTQQSY